MTRRIISMFVIVAALCLPGCDVVANTTVTLTKEERTQAQDIAEQRQQIQFERSALQSDYQAKMNRLAEKETDLNIEASRLCFRFKKAHKLEPNKNYLLDEWNGQLVKQ